MTGSGSKDDGRDNFEYTGRYNVLRASPLIERSRVFILTRANPITAVGTGQQKIVNEIGGRARRFRAEFHMLEKGSFQTRYRKEKKIIIIK